MIQSDPKYRLDETSLNNTFVRMSNGEMAPLSRFVTLTKVYGAESLARFNMYNSIAVNAVPANGYSSGDAIKAVKETAATSLPKGYGYDFGSITREENQQSNTTTIIFGICLSDDLFDPKCLVREFPCSFRRDSFRTDGFDG